MRYVIADADAMYWGHLFDEDGKEVERMCSFVYDTENEQLFSMRVQRDRDWELPTRDEMNDLEDSLKNANPEALDNPASFDLRTSDELPDWASDMAPHTP